MMNALYLRVCTKHNIVIICASGYAIFMLVLCCASHLFVAIYIYRYSICGYNKCRILFLRYSVHHLVARCSYLKVF